MQRLTRKRMLAVMGLAVATLGTTAGWTLAEAVQPPSPQAASAQAPRFPQRNLPVATGSLQAYECVQVPVTYTQTLYRRECRTETVPVTRMVPELVNETRTVTCYTPEQRMVNKPVTRYVCEPTTVVQKCYRPVPVTRTIQRTIYQTYCTTEMVNKVITRMIPECVTETVPVMKMNKVVEPQVCYVTQRIPSTSYVPVVTCVHSCGHRCGGGCGQCGGATACVSYRPVTTCTYQQVPVTRARGPVCAGNHLRPEDQDEVQSRPGDGHRSCAQSQSRALRHGQSVRDRRADAVVRRDRDQDGAQADHGNGHRLRDDHDSPFLHRHRSGDEVPARHGNRHTPDVRVCSLPGTRHGHDHPDAAGGSAGARGPERSRLGPDRSEPRKGVSDAGCDKSLK